MIKSWFSTHSSSLSTARLVVLACLAALGLWLSAGAPRAAADGGGPIWKVVAIPMPTNLPPGGKAQLVVRATNVGDSPTQGPITITDTLPAGITATGVIGVDNFRRESAGESLACSPSAPSLECTYEEPVETGDTLVVRISLEVEEGAQTPAVNHVSVAGGGAEPVVADESFTISSTPMRFGFAPGSVFVAVSDSSAGSHPDVSANFDLVTAGMGIYGVSAPPAGNAKDIRFDLPPGLVGNTVGMPSCPAAQAISIGCPADTVVGTATVSLAYGLEIATPVYNIEPSPGEPAAFEFVALVLPVRLDTSVLSDGNYGVRVTAADISEAVPVLGSEVTFWGIPADHQGPGALHPHYFGNGTGIYPFPGGIGGHSESTRVPLLSNPTQCTAPLVATASADEWGAPEVFSSQAASVGSLTGCLQLKPSASISMLPDTLEAGAPAGYSLDLRVPQSHNADALAQPDVKRVVTTLPMGAVVSPSAAWGLQACSDELFGLHSGRRAECPREAQVGTVRIKTPALSEGLEGQVYLGAPSCEVCTPVDAETGSMVRLFVQAYSEGLGGIVVKLEGHASIDQQTGQVTATFDENPQLPFDEFQLKLGGGPRAVLANPRVCGPATTSMDLTPWSAPFTSDVTPSFTFAINKGCIGSQFAPSLVSGTTNIQAGEYSPFTLSFGRNDADEFLSSLQLRMPLGLLGSLSGVPLCKEPQAAQGVCGQDSLIGHVQALTGPGADPFLVSGGQVFLTDGYKGAPFGLSIVVPAKAGPYTLSGTTGHGDVVVRAAIDVDPHTAALTVTSDRLPTMLNGIPLQLRVVNVTIDKPRFTFNPTSCDKKEVAATLASQEGSSTNVSSPFQVTNCGALGFKPKFSISASGKTSRANGASLDAKLSYPTNLGQANIARVKVSLPKQLPSRLTTLQKACTAQTFDADPAACPAASRIGTATATTPVLPVPLTGPVYFVSHGGEAFPDLVVVLQGYGVTVDLVGTTFISKAGITSTTFKTVPDVPVGSFELKLPQGKYSALAANGNLCNTKITMPTAFVAQDGAEIHQSTPISTTGCAKHKAKKAKKASKRGRHTPGGKGDSGKKK